MCWGGKSFPWERSTAACFLHLIFHSPLPQAAQHRIGRVSNAPLQPPRSSTAKRAAGGTALPALPRHCRASRVLHLCVHHVHGTQNTHYACKPGRNLLRSHLREGGCSRDRARTARNTSTLCSRKDRHYVQHPGPQRRENPDTSAPSGTRDVANGLPVPLQFTCRDLPWCHRAPTPAGKPRGTDFA